MQVWSNLGLAQFITSLRVIRYWLTGRVGQALFINRK